MSVPAKLFAMVSLLVLLAAVAGCGKQTQRGHTKTVTTADRDPITCNKQTNTVGVASTPQLVVTSSYCVHHGEILSQTLNNINAPKKVNGYTLQTLRVNDTSQGTTPGFTVQATWQKNGQPTKQQSITLLFSGQNGNTANSNCTGCSNLPTRSSAATISVDQYLQQQPPQKLSAFNIG